MKDALRTGQVDSDGRRHGMWKTFDAEGRLRFERMYLHGRRHDVFAMYHRNGRGLCFGKYANGKRTGTFDGYYADGSRWFRYELEDDRPVGIWEICHPGGKRLSRRIDWSKPPPRDGEADPRVTRFGLGGAGDSLVARWPVEPPPGTVAVFPDGARLKAMALGGRIVDVGSADAIPAFRPDAALSPTAAGMYDVCVRAPEHFDAENRARVLAEPAGAVDEEYWSACNLHAGGLQSVAVVAGDPFFVPEVIALASRLHMLLTKGIELDLPNSVADPLIAGLKAIGADAHARFIDQVRDDVDPRSRAERKSDTSLNDAFRALPPLKWPEPRTFVNDDWFRCVDAA